MAGSGKGTPGNGPPCFKAGDIFCSFLSQLLTWNKARMTLNASKRLMSHGTSLLLSQTVGFGACNLPSPCSGPSPCWPPAWCPEGLGAILGM